MHFCSVFRETLPRSYSHPWFWSPRPPGLWLLTFLLLLPPSQPSSFSGLSQHTKTYSLEKIVLWSPCLFPSQPGSWCMKRKQENRRSQQVSQPRKLSLSCPDLWWGRCGGIEGASNDSNIEKEDKIVNQSQTNLNKLSSFRWIQLGYCLIPPPGFGKGWSIFERRVARICPYEQSINNSVVYLPHSRWFCPSGGMYKIAWPQGI